MDAIWSKGKNDTLDPLSVIIKLYICSYKSSGTKISVSNNRLTIQESGLFQGLVRGYNGDKKNDVPILTMPILYACFNYLKTDMNKYKNVFEHAIEFLEKTKTTYQGNEIVYNVDTLRNYILSFMDTKNEIDESYKHKKRKDDEDGKNKTTESVSISNIYNNDGSKLKRIRYDIIATVWTERRLRMLFDIIDEIEDVSTGPENQKKMLNTLSSYMEFIDSVTHDKILGLA